MSTADPSEATPWYLSGNFAPVQDELTETDLRVTGSIPPELRGLYVRNTPNPKHGASEHWFFGDGMVHGVRLEEGRAAWYRNRWVKTKKLDSGLGAMDPAIMMDRTASAANTHVLAHAGRILALEEGHFPYELTPELDTKGCLDYGGKLQTAFTAHPKLCPETNELHFFGYGQLPPYLVYHVLDTNGDLVHSAEIEVPGPTMMHDFMITRDHAIFMDLPVTFDLQKALVGEIPIGWDESYGARIGILPRFGTNAEIRWFEVDPCYVFHPMNAYVRDGKVVCDVGRHEYMWRDSMEDFAPSYLWRWTFDLAAGTVREEALDDVAHAFPRVDDRRMGLPNRYGWVVAPRGDAAGMDAPGVVTRYDLERGTSAVHDFGPASQPGEFVFVERAAAAAEDDGWALGYVYDKAQDSTDLVILDAAHPEGEPVARVHLPRRVPHGFHGSWVRDPD
jgi:carotenoid cleavage dioxygenase-like enzyme